MLIQYRATGVTDTWRQYIYCASIALGGKNFDTACRLSEVNNVVNASTVDLLVAPTSDASVH